MATLNVTPNPAAPSTVVAIAGTGFANAKTRLLLDGQGAGSNIFRPRKDGTFNVGITVSSTAKTQTLVAQQLSGITWTQVATVSIIVQAIVVTPPPTGPTITAGPTVSNITQTGASVTWALSENCTGQIQYGTTTAYGQVTTPETSFSYSSHIQGLSGLTADTPYHLRVTGKNAAGATYTSPDVSFKTSTTVIVPPPTSSIPIPTSIDGTGATDVRAALQTFLMGVPTGSTVGFGGKQYRCDSQLHLGGRGLNLDLQGGRIFRPIRATDPLILVDGGGTGFHIHDGTVQGYHPEAGTSNAFVSAYEYAYGISIGGIQGFEIGPNLIVERFGGDCVYLNGGGGNKASGRVHHSTLRLNGRMSVAWTDGTDGTVVEFNTVQDNGYYPFDIEPNGFAGLENSNIRISDNTIQRYSQYSAVAPLTFAVTGSSAFTRNVEFSRNTVIGQPLRVGAYSSAHADTLKILNNTSNTAGGFLEFNGVTNLTYSGNTEAGASIKTTVNGVVVTPPVTPSPTGTRRFAEPTVTQSVNIPDSIDKSGTNDVTSALQSFVNGTPNGSRIVFPAGARYKMATRGFTLSGRQHLIFDTDAANPATILTFGSNIANSAFVFEGGNNHITIRNISGLNDNPHAGTTTPYVPGQESSEFVAMYHNNSYLELDHVHSSRNWGHSVYAGTHGLTETCSNVWIHDSKFELTGLYGVVFAKMDTAWVERNTFLNIGGSPLGFEDGGAGDKISHVYYGENIIDRWFWETAHTAHCIAGDGSFGAIWDDIWINKNIIKGGPVGQPRPGGAFGVVTLWGDEFRTNVRVTDNDMSSVVGAGIAVRLHNVNGGQVTGNKFGDNKEVSLWSCQNVNTTNPANT